jgi:hypothetical protein
VIIQDANVDPKKRLEMFHAHKEKMNKSMEYESESISDHQEIQATKYTIPTVYEWDIHAGEVSKKLLPPPPPRKEHTTSIGLTGKAVQIQKEGYISTDQPHNPPITLLINNYVNAVSRERRIDPNTIHRLSSQQGKPKTFDTLMNLIPSKIQIPKYGTYDLIRNVPLPSIVSTDIHFQN